MAHRPQFSQRVLGPGARIQLIAPAGPFDPAAFERGVSRLGQRYDVRFEPEILARHGYLAGDDARRSRELKAALASPDVDAIIAARGGYGVTRILPLMAASEVQVHKPLLVGFSDITALHALWAQAGVGSIHGSMVAVLGDAAEAVFARFVDALEGRFPTHFEGLETLAPGAAEGVLLGGNLAVLTALLGTPSFPPLEDAVLFLEDVNERPYRVDRMLTTWLHAGAFRGVRAIVLGAFEEGQPGSDGITLADVLRERLSQLSIPVASGLPAGHIDDNAELPFGRRVTLDTNVGRLYLQERRLS